MIVFDAQAVQSVGHGERGIARYTRELAKALAQRHPDVVDVFAYDDRLPNVERLEALGLGGRLCSFRELRGRRVDLVHVNSPFERPALADLRVPVLATATVATCYDVIPYLFSDRYLPTAAARAWYQTRLGLIQAADAVVTDSESAAADAVDLLGLDPMRVTSIGAGTSPDFAPPTDDLPTRLNALRSEIPTLLPGYVLVPAGAEWRKNVAGAVRAYALLAPERRATHQLVIASKLDGEHRREFDELCAELGVADQVVVTGYVDDADLVRLYQTAEVVMFPSFSEGFGLPVLEARRCGARVISSNTSSLPEVLPEPRALFNPFDVDDMAAHLDAALTDPTVMAALDAAGDPGFTWESAADRLVEVYHRTIDVSAAASTERSGRPVVGVVAPLRPHGDADTATVLGVIDELERIADVRAFVPDHAVALHALRLFGREGRLGIANIRTLPTFVGGGEIDHVVYCTGDAATDRASSVAARLVPGHALSGMLRGEGVPVAGGVELAALVEDLAIDVAQDVKDVIAAIVANGSFTSTST